MFGDQFIQNVDHILCAVTTPWADAETLPRKLINHTQDPHTLSIDCLVNDKVPTPNFVWVTGSQALDGVRLNASRFALLFPDLQPVATSYALHAFDIDPLPRAPHQRSYPAITISGLLLAQFHDLALDFLVRW